MSEVDAVQNGLGTQQGHLTHRTGVEERRPPPHSQDEPRGEGQGGSGKVRRSLRPRGRCGAAERL